jgi:carbamoyltransferase
MKIKFRESFRPFAPVVLAEKVSHVYQENLMSPYMLLVNQVKPEFANAFPAVTHVDGSARLQSVTEKQNPLLHKLISHFEAATGCPQLINTSFNVRGEPIVCTPKDALRCFIQTDIDSLFLGSYYLKKDQQKIMRTDPAWRTRYELD